METRTLYYNSFTLLRMKFKSSLLLFVLLCVHLFINFADACWGSSSRNYGETTRDYDLLEGSELVVNCNLHSKHFDDFNRSIDSSDLVFERGDVVYTNLTRIINDLTVQLRIPNTSIADSGLYICKITVDEKKHVVCGTKVNVGRPPKPVTNFTCLSKNFDNLFCSWNTENNGLPTEYSVQKTFLEVNFLQNCPNTTAKPNSCVWNMTTDPKYSALGKFINFTVTGNNSLGNSTAEFSLHEYTFVITNKPEELKVVNISSQSVTIKWRPPIMRNLVNPLPLQYEILIRHIFHESADIMIYNAGIDTREFTIKDLIPHVAYNVSIRCRSVEAKKENMWSPAASLLVRTNSDVPYMIPEVIPEAYELHLYGDSRSVSLYWKTISALYHNGENFHYHIKYFQNKLGPEKTSYVNTTDIFIEIKNLLKNASYSFHIYSANSIGLSKDYGSIIVDTQDKILEGPKDIRAISQDFGHYNLSWSSPSPYSDISYIVFWCSSLKPWQSRCDNPVEWSSGNITENSMILNLSDSSTNFRFAVVSKTEDRSSGMHWASCIVPHRAALGKIPYVTVEQKNSTALKVIWNLDCSAQKAVVDRYEITYCRIHKNKICKVAVTGPNNENYILQDLHPFSNYSIKIRAYNKDNLPSEDSDAKFQATLSGAPSGPPQNVTVSSKSNSSFHLSWMPPLEPNGIITKYIIHYNDSHKDEMVNSSQNKYEIDVNNLKPFAEYAVQIEACVRSDCSVKSNPVMIKTDVGEPGYMDPPRIEAENSTHLKVSWKPPLHPNGPIDFYIIEWHEEGQNVTSDANEKIKVSGEHSIFIDLKCSRLEDGGLKYLFYIRAANFKNGTSLLGPLSEPTQATACIMSQGLAMIIGIAIGGTLALAFLLLLFYKLVKWMRLKIHQVKSITIRLPKGLEGPETNPLNNYEYFKNGLNQNILPNSTERLSYIIDENESKNRHGSGSSQFSNSSTEELIFKNGKCTKFGRKPSGDSSGCSSMSSNTTPRTHLSSDSGTESDFVVPPSPDSAITDQSHNSHKPPLPILMEVHDQSTSEQHPSSHQSSFPDKQSYKYKNTIDDMILKIDQPYSKFGISGNPTSSIPWRGNPLAFYSCNLANSEPSVFDVQKSEGQNTAFAPYSKVGIAKSSGDIMNIPSVKEMGYSKFGFPTPQKRFSIPPVTVNPVAIVKVGNSPMKDTACMELNNKPKKSDDIYKVQPLNVSTEDLVEDCGYIKFGMNNLCSQKSSPGYVPFSDLKGQQDHSPIPTSVNPSDPKDFYSSSSTDVDFSDDLKWPPDNPECEVKTDGIPEVLFNVPLSQKPLDGLLMEAGASNSEIYNFNLPSTGNYVSSLHKVSSESDIKYPYSSPYSKVNNHFFPEQPSYLPYTDHVSLPSKTSSFEESHSDGLHNLKTANYDISNEVVINPVTLKKDYVPVSSLSDNVCDRTLSNLPNIPTLNSPRNVFPNGVCTEADNYVTPSNKGDLRLLRDDSLSKTDSISPLKQKNSLSETKIPVQNGLGYINGSLKYILTPLPKMESEICEV